MRTGPFAPSLKRRATMLRHMFVHVWTRNRAAASVKDGHGVGPPSRGDPIHMALCPQCGYAPGAIAQHNALRPVDPDANSFSCETCGRRANQRGMA